MRPGERHDPAMPGVGGCAMTLTVKVQRWQGSVPPNPAALRSVLEAEGYSAYAWTDDRGTTYEPHVHDDDQTHRVVRGAITLKNPMSKRDSAGPVCFRRIATRSNTIPSSTRPSEHGYGTACRLLQASTAPGAGGFFGW